MHTNILLNSDHTITSIEHSDEPASQADVDTVFDNLRAYNWQHAPPDNHQHLRIFVRNSNGEIIGGLLGDTFWGWLYISILWLHDRLRGQGMGTKLLEMAEAEGVRRGCHHAFLDTMSFQALPFYEKHGYTVFGVLEDFPIGHSRYYLKKSLREE